MNLFLLGLILQYSAVYNIDPVLAIAVAQKESSFDVNCIGPTNDVGLFQLNPQTFRRFTRKQLLDPERNIKLGIQYLAEQRDHSPFKKGFTWINSYNVGPVANTYKYPEKFKYYMDVKKIYDELKAGDKVTVKGMYNLIHDGIGTYLGESREAHYKGFLRVENEYKQIMRVHPERVKKCQE